MHAHTWTHIITAGNMQKLKTLETDDAFHWSAEKSKWISEKNTGHEVSFNVPGVGPEHCDYLSFTCFQKRVWTELSGFNCRVCSVMFLSFFSGKRMKCGGFRFAQCLCVNKGQVFPIKLRAVYKSTLENKQLCYLSSIKSDKVIKHRHRYTINTLNKWIN